MYKIKRSIALLLILAIGVASAGSYVFADQIFVGNDKHVVVDFTANIPDGPFVVKRGQSTIIPIDIMAPSNKDINLQVYVSEPNDISRPGLQTEEKFSQGMSANVPSKHVEVAPQSDMGDTNKNYAVRDTLPLSVSASKDASVGDHIISFTLYEDGDERKFITFYLHVSVVN